MKQQTDSFGNVKFPGKVCSVVKSIYSAREAGKIWGSHIHKKLLDWNFCQSSQNQRLYFFNLVAHFLILIIVVDDMAFASDEQQLIDKFKAQLTFCFKANLLGTLSSFIGWQLRHTAAGVYVDQSKYVERLLLNHNLLHIKPVCTPLPVSVNTSSRRPNESALSLADNYRSRSLVGSLGYHSVCLRPDFSFSVSVLSRQLHDPTIQHLSLPRRVVLYVAETCDKSTLFSSTSQASLTAYVDSDWAGFDESRGSTTSISITVNGAPLY